MQLQLFVFSALFIGTIAKATTLSPVQTKIIKSAQNILDSAKISYVYGGHRIGGAAECKSCNLCLETKKPKPKQRFKVCGECYACSLDCSHFVHRVYSDAGLNSLILRLTLCAQRHQLL